MMKNVLIGLFVILLVGGMFAVGKYVGWGFVETKNQNKIRVTGEAKEQQKSQIANVNAGVNTLNDSKEQAIKIVNDTIDKVIKAVKAERIAPAAI